MREKLRAAENDCVYGFVRQSSRWTWEWGFDTSDKQHPEVLKWVKPMGTYARWLKVRGTATTERRAKAKLERQATQIMQRITADKQRTQTRLSTTKTLTIPIKDLFSVKVTSNDLHSGGYDCSNPMCQKLQWKCLGGGMGSRNHRKEQPVSDDIKYIDIKEFQDFGYLQEANRQFFHPHGLALEVNTDDEGKTTITGVWDYRDDPEGISFAGSYETDLEEKANRVSNEWDRRTPNREATMGYMIQPTEPN